MIFYAYFLARISTTHLFLHTFVSLVLIIFDLSMIRSFIWNLFLYVVCECQNILWSGVFCWLQDTPYVYLGCFEQEYFRFINVRSIYFDFCYSLSQTNDFSPHGQNFSSRQFLIKARQSYRVVDTWIVFVEYTALKRFYINLTRICTNAYLGAFTNNEYGIVKRKRFYRVYGGSIKVKLCRGGVSIGQIYFDE